MGRDIAINKPFKQNLDNQKYLVPSWEEMGENCFLLAQKILKKEKKIDRLVALVKGGLTWSRTLLDYLGIEELSAFQVKFYSNIGKTAERPVIVQSLPIMVENESILLFDDVTDSGETLTIASDYLKMCGAKSITTASLFLKPWAKIKPDYYAQSTDAWIVFPHEIRETVSLLYQKWTKAKVNPSEIRVRLLTLGLPKNQVDYFLKLNAK